MSRDKISEWSPTAGSNTDVGGININEGCPPATINNALREIMAQVKDFSTGYDNDNFVVGGNFTVDGTTTLTGVATGPTAVAGTNTTQLATTAFVTAANTAQGLGTMATQASNSVNITGGTITGTTVNGLTLGTNGTGAKTISSSTPSGGSDGDIWYQI
jgi:hypothetical protein|tara:strand:- start:1397 stop:1873 length:477 start_codon:yes stop_codon:yes gene_type:complete